KVDDDGDRVKFEDLSLSAVSLHEVEVRGQGPLADLGHFIDRILQWDLTVRIPDGLQFESDGGRNGEFTARFLLPVFESSEPPPVPFGGIDFELEREQMRIARLRETKALLEGLIERSRSGLYPAAVAAIDSMQGQLTVGVTHLRVGDDVVVEGAVVGSAARAELFQTLDAGGLRVVRLGMPVAGACRPFVMTIVRNEGGTSTEPANDSGAFGNRATSLCSAEPLPVLGRVALRGKATGADALALRLRDATISHFFFVLHELTGADFVVDKVVRGTVDVDIEGATLEETLAALNAIDLVVSAGPLRRVSRAGERSDETPAREYTGEPLSITLSDAELRSVLCVFQNITGLPILVSPGVGGTTAIYADEMPWEALLDGVVRAAGFTYALDEASVFVGTKDEVDARAKSPGGSACASADAEWSLRSARPLAPELAVADLILVGSGSYGNRRLALAYGPWRQLNVLEPEVRLWDGVVQDAAVDRVTILTESSGRVEMRLKD
ncbi:MAG: hypothetical protein ACSLFQ_10930, partial [Thermoanaerobaculia bacterium]